MKSKIKNYLVFGCILLTTKVSFGLNVASEKKPVVFSEKNIHNIAVFNKVYGCVRHFSPTLAVDTFYGWEELLVRYLPLIETAKSDNELCNIIQTCFATLEPKLVLKPWGKESQSTPSKKTCQDYYVHRYNKGWGNRNENATKMKFLYSSTIEKCSVENKFQVNYENILIEMPLTAL